MNLAEINLSKQLRTFVITIIILSFTCLYTNAQTETSIAEVQGTGSVSPLLNDQISLRSVVVIAAHRNLLFVQSPTPDNDDRTSEGVLVIWENAEDFELRELIDIVGTVRELDDITSIQASSITPTGEINNSIAAKPLSNEFPGSIRESINRLEYVESQLVSFTNLSITGPSQGSDLAYVSPSNQRPMREPGIEFPGINDLPLWDGNPEVFYFVPDGLGLSSNAFLHANMKISGTGIIIEDRFNYALLPITYNIVEENPLPEVLLPSSNEFNIGCLNTLFLEHEDSDYDLRLEKISQYIINQLGTPDIVALQEVGGTKEFVDLAEVLSDATGYSYSAYSQNATGSINNGYLVRGTFTVDNLAAQGTNLSFEGGGLHDRPPLLLRGFINTEEGRFPLSILNLHMRSLSGIEGSGGDFVRRKRHAQAISVSQMVQTLQGQEEQFLLVGDFNAFQFSDGYVDVVNQIAGTASLGALLEVQAQGIAPLTNISTTFTPEEEQYSFVFRGNAQILDHCLASDFTDFEVSHFHFGRGNSDYPESYLNQEGAFRASDHDGFAVYLDMKTDIILGDTVVPSNLAIAVPNPFTLESRIAFQLQEKQNLQLDLYNLAGQLMYSTSLGAIENDKISIPYLQTFTSGMYIMKIAGKSVDFIQKVVIVN